MKLLAGAENLIDKKMNGKNLTSIEMIEVILAQRNLVDN